MADNEQIVRNFIAAWSNLDVDELVDYFAEDGTYYNIPVEPVSGRNNLHRFISAFISDWDRTSWDIVNLVAQGDLVMVERLDRTRSGEHSVDLPCLGVFEMSDGKIVEWRDYFDMNTYVRAMSA